MTTRDEALQMAIKAMTSGFGMVAAVEACRAALSEPVTMPDGWVALPVELADAMHDAFSDTAVYEVEGKGVCLTNINQCYQALIQATPTCEKEKG